MHLSPVDIGNVAKFNIGEQLERRRRSVQLVVGPPCWGDDLKLPPAPRRQSLVERCQTSLRKSKVGFSPGNFSTPFLPPIVPKSASATSALSPPFSANTLRFRRHSAFSRALHLPPLFLSVLNDAKNDEGEEEEEEEKAPISGSSTISSDQREPLRRPLIIEALQPNCQPAAEVFNEDADVEQSSLTFDVAQELLAEQRAPELVRKLDVVRCRRMANEMMNELLERLQQINLPKQSGGDEENTQKQNNKKLAMAELQRDFFPYVYAKAERLFVYRMANPFLDGTLENSAASKY
ncbi:hypothetical protein GPALN_005851 [Globodera pallida]|nr:hypothetical protein GPALN_005851 [Globodera pallida]